MSYIDDTGINEQFEKINSKTSDPPNTTNIPFFNITDKIIDKINDDKYLIKIGFRELLAYASPIVFNRELEQTKIDLDKK